MDSRHSTRRIYSAPGQRMATLERIGDSIRSYNSVLETRGLRQDYRFCVFGYHISVFTLISYAVDWVVYLVVLVIGLVYGQLAWPRETQVDISRDVMYSYKLENECFVPIWLLVVFVAIVPLFFFCLITFGLSDDIMPQKLWNMHCVCLSLLAGISLDLFVVSCIKNVASVPRPDFFNRCLLPGDDVLSLGLIAVSDCLQEDMSILKEGLRSFPSAHTSTIFTSSTIQLLYTSDILRLYDGSAMSWKFVLAILYTVTTSTVISSSRISDHRHRVSDVVVGAILGVVAGLAGYLLHFTAGRAYPPRRLCHDDRFWRIDHHDRVIVSMDGMPPS